LENFYSRERERNREGKLEKEDGKELPRRIRKERKRKRKEKKQREEGRRRRRTGEERSSLLACMAAGLLGYIIL